MLHRWSKLDKDLYNVKKKIWDFSKLTEIYDCIKYDVLYNSNIDADGIVSVAVLWLISSSDVIDRQYSEIYKISSLLSTIVDPLEYGLEPHEKVSIACRFLKPLISKFLADIDNGLLSRYHIYIIILTLCITAIGPAGFKHETSVQIDYTHAAVKSPNRSVRSRLYFSSESHLHAFVNILRFGSYGEFAKARSSEWMDEEEETSPVSRAEAWEQAKEYLSRARELNYLTMIVCRVFELQRPNGNRMPIALLITYSWLLFQGYIVEWQLTTGNKRKTPGEAFVDKVEPMIILHRGLTRELVGNIHIPIAIVQYRT